MVEGNFFEQVENSRQNWKVKHSVSELLTVAMCGVSAGERSIYGIREFARRKEQWLKDVIGLKLPAGIPSYDTVRRVLGILDPKQFQDVFTRWIEHELAIPPGSYVSLDGKSLRGSGEKKADIEPLHLLHAYSHQLGVVIGQMECSREKTNEIPIDKKLIKVLKIKDAINC
nr:ISAs1 family transposase [uncultured Treponema sp.]